LGTDTIAGLRRSAPKVIRWKRSRRSCGGRTSEDTARSAVETALARRVRGTHDPKSEYSANDIVAKDGGTFIARKDNPGSCPGPGWQLMAKQGQRGIAGPRGERGSPGKPIDGWIVDRSNSIAEFVSLNAAPLRSGRDFHLDMARVLEQIESLRKASPRRLRHRLRAWRSIRLSSRHASICGSVS